MSIHANFVLLNYIHYNEHHGPKKFHTKVENNYYKYSLSFFLIMKIPSKVTTPHGIEHIMCMKNILVYWYIYIITMHIKWTRQT